MVKVIYAMVLWSKELKIKKLEKKWSQSVEILSVQLIIFKIKTERCKKLESDYQRNIDESSASL